MISETLKTNIKKLREARKEIHKAALMARAMKEAGDDIANQVIVAVVEAFVSDDTILDFWKEASKSLLALMKNELNYSRYIAQKT